MAEIGYYVRVMREGKVYDLNLTEMTRDEVKEWIRTKQLQNPDYDIECIMTLANTFREKVI